LRSARPRVQIGTAFLLCPEADHGAVIAQALRARRTATPLHQLFTGRAARGIVNRLMRELGPIAEDAPAFPLASAALAPLRAWAEARGSGDFSPLWAGQNVDGCRTIGAAELTRQLAQGHG
jgi:nitronate monooxygenase